MSDARVCFCPSPIGIPHVGLIHTALFNWAYARHTGGKLIFHIEDADAARDSEESYQAIIETLNWLGINWDEGIDVGSPHGPYRQSQRRDIYADVLQHLIDAGEAYEAFSTAEEVEERHRAAGRDPELGYDNCDRNLTEEQKEIFRMEGRKPVTRLRMLDEDIAFEDLVRGRIKFKAGLVPDFVTARSNGESLYTLVNPADDALMEITHTLCDEDLPLSTPCQIALYELLKCIGVAKFIPELGYLPFAMGEGNKKLPKCDPQSNLFIHCDNGFIREGPLNYLALLGWSTDGDQDIFTMDEMVKTFDIHDILSNSACFDQKKADAINADHTRMLDPKNFEQRLHTYLESHFDFPADYPADKFAFLVTLLQTHVKTFSDAWGLSKFLVIEEGELTFDGCSVRRNFKEDAVTVLKATTAAVEPLSEEDFVIEKLEATFQKALIEDLELKLRKAFGPVCMAVTGAQVSSPLFESIELLGRSRSLGRLHKALEVTSFAAAQ